MPPRAVVAARLLVAFFCWFTAAYAFVASSAFAYLQFLKPRVFDWVSRAGELHRFAAWGWLALVVLILASGWRNSAGRRWGSAALGGCCAAAVMWNTMHPVLPALKPGGGAVLADVWRSRRCCGCLSSTTSTRRRSFALPPEVTMQMRGASRRRLSCQAVCSAPL